MSFVHLVGLSDFAGFLHTLRKTDLKKIQGVTSSSVERRGGFCMMSRSGGLKPRAVAGGPSVTRFTHKSCTGMRFSGRPRAAVRKIQATSPMLLLIMYRMKAFMLL